LGKKEGKGASTKRGHKKRKKGGRVTTKKIHVKAWTTKKRKSERGGEAWIICENIKDVSGGHKIKPFLTLRDGTMAIK